jgi:hypothetical protein
MLPPKGGVEASSSGFGAHGFCWLLEGNQYAYLCFLTFDHTPQISEMCDVGMPRFDGQDGLLGLPTLALVVKVQPPINVLVGPLLLLRGPGTDEASYPPLKLVRILRSERLSIWLRYRLADDDAGSLEPDGIIQTMFDQGDSQVHDVNTDPATLEALTHSDRRATAAKGVEYRIAFVAAGLEDAFEGELRLLCRIAKSFFRLTIEGWDIGPDSA